MPQSTFHRVSALFCAIIFVVAIPNFAIAQSNATDSIQTKAATALNPSKLDDDLPAEVMPYVDAAKEKWESAIASWEQQDQTTVDPKDAILLIGSSSIRRWDTAATDLSPYNVIGRGYGGAKFTDLAVFAKRLIQPHQYQAVVIFVANDITGGDNDRPQDVVQACVKHVVNVAQAHSPNSPVFLIEVTPTSSRRKGWPKVRQLNSWLREYSLTTANVSFVATAEWYLDDKDEVRDEYFVQDKLHLNRKGYAVWGSLVKRELDRVLRPRQQ
ncbi:MAG: GDSL-type esterase/lipase family protein [Fuerstiella sp.]